MSSSINALNGSGMSLQFEEFARLAGKSSNVVRFLGSADAPTVHEVSVTKSDKVGNTWFRSDRVKTANDTTRAIFRQSVASMFGGEDHIPENVRKAMKLDDYGKGKPLTTKRIMAVKVAVEAAMAFPGDRPRISAPAAHVRQAWPEGGPLSAKDVTDRGYAPAELKKLANVVDIYQKATNCSLEEAQKAVLDPKSAVRRLYGYGGAFTANAENFAKGLALMDSFSTWYDDFIQTKENTESPGSLLSNGKLAVEKFLFEEIGCNPKLMDNAGNSEDVFGTKNNLAMRFINKNMMLAISGSMAGISPEKRSVVYALADALCEKPPEGKAFYYNAALLSRTLVNFPKAAELVYSGNLNRTTAFNLLFPDLKGIGLSANTSNEDISSAVYEYTSFEEEAQAAYDPNDLAPQKAIYAQGRECGEMFNWSGASIQECRRAAKSGQTLPKAPGMTDITAGLEAASGLTDAGKEQFIADIHRPVPPSDPKTKEPLIDLKDCVFRFDIAGQKFTAKACGHADRNNAQNADIAKAVEKFCNKEVHPVQTDAVFFALSQGGLAPQMSLRDHGYEAADHGPITYTLSKDAETGSVSIRYSNPEGSPLKFSWTATVDVEGKVVTTPIQIEE